MQTCTAPFSQISNGIVSCLSYKERVFHAARIKTPLFVYFFRIIADGEKKIFQKKRKMQTHDFFPNLWSLVCNIFEYMLAAARMQVSTVTAESGHSVWVKAENYLKCHNVLSLFLKNDPLD